MTLSGSVFSRLDRIFLSGRKCCESGFDRAILDYICKKLREGASTTEIIEEVTDSTDPLFLPICGDVGIAADYLSHAKTLLSITPH